MPKLTREKLIRESISIIEKLKIIHETWPNISIKHASSKLGLSQRYIRRIRDFLIENNMIRFSLSINYPILGVFTALVSIKLADIRNEKILLKTLKKFEFIEDIYTVGGGDITHILRVRVLSYNELNGIVNTLLEMMPRIEFTITQLVYNYFIDSDKNYVNESLQKRIKLDKINLEILNELNKNSATPLLKLSKKINLAPSTLHRRIKYLKKKKVINGYIIHYNWENIPSKFLPITALCKFKRTALFNPQDILNLTSIKNSDVRLNFLYHTYGEVDAVFEIKTSTLSKFRRFVYEELPTIYHLSNINIEMIINKYSRAPLLRTSSNEESTN